MRQDDAATQALGYLEREKDKSQPVIPQPRDKKRRILLPAYQSEGLKPLDLTRAQEMLRRTIEPPKKEDRGKEL
jgi:hypothetical protein